MICQTHLPIKAWMNARSRRLPGMQAVSIAQWLYRDEVYGAQMAYRDKLIQTRRSHIYAGLPQASEAERELLAIIDAESGYRENAHMRYRSDGVQIDITSDAPLCIAGRLIQEDLCILMPVDEVYTLTAGLMCFPSHWDIRQKIGRSVTHIHTPVPEFSPVADSVNRMLGAIRVEQPLIRANFLIYTDPELHQPCKEGQAKSIDPQAPRYVRVERQTFRRLPETLAVVFAIHTSLVPASSLTEAEFECLAALKPDIRPVVSQTS